MSTRPGAMGFATGLSAATGTVTDAPTTVRPFTQYAVAASSATTAIARSSWRMSSTPPDDTYGASLMTSPYREASSRDWLPREDSNLQPTG